DWQKIVPPETPHRAEVRDVPRFRSALEAARKQLFPDRLAVCLRLTGNHLSVETEQEPGPGQVIPVQRPEGASQEVSCWFSPRVFQDWAAIVLPFTVELPETTDVPAVFRSDGLDFYVTPLSPGRPNEQASEAEAVPEGAADIEESEEFDENLPEDEWQDGRD